MVPIETLTASIETKEALFIRLYQEVFPKVAHYVAQKGGDLSAAQDVFQEALVIYYEKVHLDGFIPTSSHHAYLFGVVKHLWSKAFRERMQTQALEQLEIAAITEETIVPERILLFLETAGQKCMELLQSFYYEKLSMAKLAQKYGFGSERSAAVQKYKCLEKVREEVKSKSWHYENFTD